MAVAAGQLLSLQASDTAQEEHQHMHQTAVVHSSRPHQFQKDSGYCALGAPQVRKSCLFSHVTSSALAGLQGGLQQQQHEQCKCVTNVVYKVCAVKGSSAMRSDTPPQQTFAQVICLPWLQQLQQLLDSYHASVSGTAPMCKSHPLPNVRRGHK